MAGFAAAPLADGRSDLAMELAPQATRDALFLDSYCAAFLGHATVGSAGATASRADTDWLGRTAPFNDHLQAIYVCLFDAGLVQQRRPQPTWSHQSLERWLRVAANSVEDSPMPDSEWVGLSERLSDLLPGLVGASPSSVSRYRSNVRPTPDSVAVRLHVLALIVTDLAGSYNDFGIRRWFQRPRAALNGQAPIDILTGAWDPDSDDVQRVRRLAGWLTGQASGDPVPAR